MTDLFNKTREFVEVSFDNRAQMLHFDRTVYWLQQLKPDADEAFLIATLGHDIERAFRTREEGLGRSRRGFLDKDYLIIHQEKGTEILARFLRDNNADESIITRVRHLVSKHEVGGDVDQNLLKDADSVSFVENQAETFLAKMNDLGFDKIKEKFDWMYNRITSQKAKALAKPFYEKMMKLLNAELERSKTN